MPKQFGSKEAAKAAWTRDSLALNVQDATYNKNGVVVEGRKFTGSMILPSGELAVFEIYQRAGEPLVKEGKFGETIWLAMSIKGGVK